uniref:(northern house mosquito) hypothetical protein n=1 Tax=Culex pipiens TaxID=7175 RepID=A0A8D8BQI1_CULPI
MTETIPSANGTEIEKNKQFLPQANKQQVLTKQPRISERIVCFSSYQKIRKSFLLNINFQRQLKKKKLLVFKQVKEQIQQKTTLYNLRIRKLKQQQQEPHAIRSKEFRVISV